MYTSPEVRDLGAVQALTLAGSPLKGTITITKSNTTIADSNAGVKGGLPHGSNCTIPLLGIPCT